MAMARRSQDRRPDDDLDKVVVDRTAELSSWVDFCYQIMKRGVLIYAYANNHFQGHGPATIAKFLEIWAANGFGTIAVPERSKQQQTTLFPAMDSFGPN